MPLSSEIVGRAGEPLTHELDARWTMAFAAGLDDLAPEYLDTRARPDVLAHPLFPVCFEWPLFLAPRHLPASPGLSAAERVRGVHATHDLRLDRPIRAGMRVTTTATVVQVEPRKPGAYQVTRFDSVDATGQPVCSTWYGTLLRGVSVEGPARRHADGVPTLEPAAATGPCEEVLIPIAANAAHVYTECARIWNPIHTDAAVAAHAGLPEIILHGTASLALAVSQLVRRALDGESERVLRIGARFGGMVLMPSTLLLRILHADGADAPGVVRFEASNHKGELALRDGRLEFPRLIRMLDSPEPSPETLAAQALGRSDDARHSVVPPLWPSVSYERAPDGSYPGGHSYTRDQNPSYDAPEALLARLEGGADALLFASGMAAASSVLEALEPGAHVVAPRSMYWTLRLWLGELSATGRLRVDFVPTGDLEALRAALRPGETRLVWVETPANPLCEITDLAAAAELAHGAGARLAADSTLATPALTRPLELGADLVMHSATKQLNGHGDVVAGALVCARDDALWQAIRHERAYRGAILGPFEAWLLLRGMRTLYLRVARSAASAQRVAEFLATQDGVSRVCYPGLPSHPGHALAARQMRGGFGPIVSFCSGGDEAGARRVLSRLRLFRDATSLGSVESLVEHRRSVEGEGSAVPADLLRLSIGIEAADDLIADLRAALSAARA